MTRSRSVVGRTEFTLDEILAVIGGVPVDPDASPLVVAIEDEDPPRIVRFALEDAQALLRTMAGRNPRPRHRREALQLLGVHLDELFAVTDPIGDPVVIDSSGLRLANPVPEAYDDRF